jgi:glycosyltransferase involved in cell wall biosynthesis
MGCFLHRLAREMPNVRVLAPGAAGYPEHEWIDGVNIRRFPYPAPMDLAYTGQLHVNGSCHPIRFARFLWAFWRALHDELLSKPDVVHAHWWFPSGWMAMRAGYVPVVVTVHGTDVRLIHKVPFAQFPAARVLRYADKALAVSPFLARVLHALDVRDYGILPMPPDEAFVGAVPAPPENPPRFVVAGRLAKQKRVDLAIRALPPGARLDVIGDGPERARLEALRPMELRIRFYPPKTAAELVGFYRGATANVVCSKGEGYGLSVVEAAHCGVPTIGVRSGAIPDLVRPMETGMLVSPEADRLSEAMRWARDHPAEMREMGGAARRAVRDRTPRFLAEQHLEVYARTRRLAGLPMRSSWDGLSEGGE